VRLGLSLPVFTADARRSVDVARRAAAAGYHGMFAPDHLFPPGRPDRPSLDALSLLAAVAAAVPGIPVGTLVTRAGVRPVGILAKQLAGLAHVAGGSVIAGLGMGDAHARDEHAALGIPFLPIDERAGVLEETALALGALFGGRPWSGGVHVPPVTGPLLPPATGSVWLGGRGDRVVRAAGRSAAGWNGWALDAQGFSDRAANVREAAAEAGRDPERLTLSWGGIVLVGRDPAELAVLETERASRGMSMDVWRGTADDLRGFADRLERAEASWLICVPAGPPDRLELVARTLREG
jgi:alkanesulfonate monooxygenase SsuD/methylene tetrahydromethanopterin reductase-like flavin-dependent oxidoreductase (luciferase family)